MAEPRVAHALFCDEIRTDSGGKVSYLGVHAGDLVLDGKRRGSPLQFAVIAWLICDVVDLPDWISLRVYGPPTRQLLNSNEIKPASPPRRPDSTKAFFHFALERISLPLAQEGSLEVSIETETGVLRAGRLQLRFANHAPPLPAQD